MKDEKRATKARENASDVLVWVLLGFAVLIVVLSFVHFGLRKDAGTLVSTECEVVDKYSQRVGRKFDRKSYHLTLLFVDGTTECVGTIDVSKQTFYEDVKIGDVLLCNVMYDENGIIEIEVQDERIEQFTTTEAFKTGIIVLTVFVAVLGAIAGAIVLYIKRSDNKTSEERAFIEQLNSIEQKTVQNRPVPSSEKE